MKRPSKLLFVLLLMLVTFSALSLFPSSVNAAGNQVINLSISAKNAGVSQDTSNTFTISNGGPANLGSINITIPEGGNDYTKIRNLVISEQPASQNWTITQKNNFVLLYGSSQGLSPGQNITFAFDATNPKIAGNYRFAIGANENTSVDALNAPEFNSSTTSSIQINSITAAILIFLIATGIALANTALNRVLINYFVGWEQYRVMQKEMNEYRSQTMAAARANDKKQMEKLKRKQSQINAMQAKMMKPQMVQFAASFLYIFIWFFVLTPTFGNTSMVFVPGFGPIAVIYWYPICSFFLGLLSSRILGIMPLEP
jgi:uncharacterized membrane protein (DUF106 family)